MSTIKTLNALGMNIFGGGFTLGVQRVFNVVAQYEECNAGSRTFDLNSKYFGTIPRPLKFTDWDVDGMRHKVQLVYANPPCAPWSSANARLGHKREQRFEDPRLDMTRRTMQSALHIEPEVFVCESVTNAYTTGKAYYDRWAERWNAKGYAVTYWLSDALLHGVPSTRQRFHFIAHRYALDLTPPDMKNFMPVTVRAAIWDIRNKLDKLPQHVLHNIMEPSAIAIAKYAGEGGLLQRAQKESGLPCRRKYGFLVRRLLWDAPAYTVLNLRETVHPDGERWVTWRESMRMCGYPDDFVIHADREATQAVLPPMGEVLARIAKKSIEQKEPAAPGIHLVDWRHLAEPYRPGAVRAAMDDLI